MQTTQTADDGSEIKSDETEEVILEQQEDPKEDPKAVEGESEAEAEEMVVTIPGESPSPEDEEVSKAPEWVRNLRKEHRELKREKRELEERLKSVSEKKEEIPVLGKKPTLEDCDYDAEKFEQELDSWHLKKQSVEAEAAKQRAAKEAEENAWKAKLESYSAARTTLKVKDYEDAEAAVQDTFSVPQQAIMLKGAKNPATLIYALGKNPKKAKELAEFKDPVEFAFAVARLEETLKVEMRKPASQPEKTVKSTGASSGSIDSTLERLRSEAERTGNYTKVIAYKKSLKK